MRLTLRTQLAATLALGAVAAGTAPASASPLYSFLTDIAIPVAANNTSGGKFNGFDISAFDGTSQLAYVADRSNGGVDVFSSATDSFVTRAPGFVGVGPSNALSGPDGVALVGNGGASGTQHVLWAGDGNSTAVAFSITGSASSPTLTKIATVNTGGSFRVDEMAYDSKDHLLLVANNADTPPFATLINTTTNAIATKLTFDGTTGPASPGGIEASVYSPTDGKFYLNLVQLPGTSLSGGLVAIDPTTFATKTFDFSKFGISDCSPSGISLTTNNKLFIGCGDTTQDFIFDPNANGGAGAVVATFAEKFGADEVWCDPTSGLCFAAARNATSGLGELDIVDPINNILLQSIPTVGGAHSVTVDPVTGQVLVPEGVVGNSGSCVNGCIAVFTPVPEPASLAVLAAGLLAMVGLQIHRRRV